MFLDRSFSCVDRTALTASSTFFSVGILMSRPFFPKDDNPGVLMSIVLHVYVGGWGGVGSCPAVDGRGPGRIRRRPARSKLSEVLYQVLSMSDTPVWVLSTRTSRVARVWILSRQTFRIAGVWILYDFIYKRSGLLQDENITILKRN